MNLKNRPPRYERRTKAAKIGWWAGAILLGCGAGTILAGATEAMEEQAHPSAVVCQTETSCQAAPDQAFMHLTGEIATGGFGAVLAGGVLSCIVNGVDKWMVYRSIEHSSETELVKAFALLVADQAERLPSPISRAGNHQEPN